MQVYCAQFNLKVTIMNDQSNGADYEKMPITADSALKLSNQMCFPLYSAANAVVRAYRPLLEQLDLTYAQYLVMLVLWEFDGISVKTLGEKLYLDSGTLTPLLKRLETKALISRQRSTTDERMLELFLTEAGRLLKNDALTIPTDMMCKLGLELDDLSALKNLCMKLINTQK
jgi:MarR family transcriptional regulator, organic hydroperoxide resistance regulator